MSFPFITILTPVYNRASTLERLKASIEAQSFRDFEWLVVDDGSTDEGPSMLAEWERLSGGRMRLIRAENGGKHRALNRGLPSAMGRWIFIVDSDDMLPPDALARIARAAPEAESMKNCAGIMGLKTSFAGRLVGEPLPAGLRFADAACLTFRYGLRGDKAEVFKADVLKAFPFPEFSGERFLTEGLVWYRMSAAGYSLMLLDEPLYLCEYRDDGLSARSLELRIANPRGTRLFYKEILDLKQPPTALLREAVNYVRFALHSGRLWDACCELSTKGRFLAVLGFLPGLAAYALDRARLHRRAAVAGRAIFADCAGSDDSP